MKQKNPLMNLRNITFLFFLTFLGSSLLAGEVEAKSESYSIVPSTKISGMELRFQSLTPKGLFPVHIEKSRPLTSQTEKLKNTKRKLRKKIKKMLKIKRRPKRQIFS